MRWSTLFPLLLASLFHSCWGKIAITKLSVPPWVLNGSDPSVLLDCQYSHEAEDQKLVVKWFLDNNTEPVYQWIPELGSRTVSELLQPFLDMQYTADDPDTKFRALRLRKPTVDVGGRYTCVVSSISSQDTEAASMVIYAPARKMELSLSKLSPDTLAINCEADEVYPEPKLRLYFDLEDSALMDTDESKDDSPELTPTVILDRSNGTSESKSQLKPASLETNSQTVSEDGSKETNEQTNSEETSEGTSEADDKKENGEQNAKPNGDLEKKSKKSEGTSESVGSQKSVGTSESRISKEVSDSDENEDPAEMSEESEEIPSKKVIAVRKGKMYRVRIRSEIKLKRMDREVEFECILEIPGTEYVQRQKMMYRPESTTTEGGVDGGGDDDDDKTASETENPEDILIPSTQFPRMATSRPSSADLPQSTSALSSAVLATALWLYLIW